MSGQARRLLVMMLLGRGSVLSGHPLDSIQAFLRFCPGGRTSQDMEICGLCVGEVTVVHVAVSPREGPLNVRIGEIAMCFDDRWWRSDRWFLFDVLFGHKPIEKRRRLAMRFGLARVGRLG